MSDFCSGQDWVTLNEFFDTSIQGTAFAYRDGTDDRSVRSLQAFMEMISTLTNVKLLWSGSVIDGSMVDPLIREEGFESDGMYVPLEFILSPTQQEEMFCYCPDAPGYVKLEVMSSRSCPLIEAKFTNFALSVKAIQCQGNNPTRYFIVVDKNPVNEKDDISCFSPSTIPSDFLRSIVDTLNLDRLQMNVSNGSPALTMSMWGFNYLFQTVENLSMPTFLTTLLGNYLRRLSEQNSGTPGACGTQLSRTSPRNDFVRDVRKNEFSLSMDIVLAIECIGWPEIAHGFFQRNRNWPDDITLAKLRQGGFHLVYKPLIKDSPNSVEWRISFSQAELTLFESMEPLKRTCYRIFKLIYYCELRSPKILCSYYMKTIFFWMCEKLPRKAWVESNLAQIIMGLLDDLLHCLVTKTCPHYFIPKCNLFGHAYEEFLFDLARKVLKIRSHPEMLNLKGR